MNPLATNALSVPTRHTNILAPIIYSAMCAFITSRKIVMIPCYGRCWLNGLRAQIEAGDGGFDHFFCSSGIFTWLESKSEGGEEVELIEDEHEDDR
jgi:hypothetical protein